VGTLGLRNAGWEQAHQGSEAAERPASSTDPKTWSPFDECLEAYRRGDCDGIGFAGLEETVYSGIDIDHCVNLETREISPEALNIIQSLDSYAEFTPSDGIRIWIVGEKPDHSWVSNKSDPERAVDIEVYSAGRFFTITGQLLPGVHDIIIRDTEGALRPHS
jgi:putative DNA primase/helicase